MGALKNGYLRAELPGSESRRGPEKAITAIAAAMLKATCNMLREDVS